MIPAYIIKMLQLQDRLNREVHPEWIKQDFNWSRAIYVESVELLEHVGWKWWKKQELNLKQAQLELVDIWHFILSNALVEADGNIQKATLALVEEWDITLDKVVVMAGSGEPSSVANFDLQRQIEMFGAMAGVSGVIILPLFRHICERLELSDSGLFEIYVTKNVLNLFRQANGYKTGQYKKSWFGQEDNEVLMEIVMNMPELLLAPDELMAQLKARYSAVA